MSDEIFEPPTAADVPTDAQGEPFDPELHATKPNGDPALKTDGTWRKKRRDAGRGRAAAGRAARAAAPKRSAGPPPGTPKVLAEQHAKHVRVIKDNAAIPLTLASFFSPIDAYSLQPLVEPFAQALATVAQDDPKTAAVLDKLAGTGGWATVGAIAAVGIVQVLGNHGKIPAVAVKAMGGKTREELEAEMRAHGEQLAEASHAA